MQLTDYLFILFLLDQFPLGKNAAILFEEISLKRRNDDFWRTALVYTKGTWGKIVEVFQNSKGVMRLSCILHGTQGNTYSRSAPVGARHVKEKKY